MKNNRGTINRPFRIRRALNTGEIKLLDNDYCECRCGQVFKINSFYSHLRSRRHFFSLMNSDKTLDYVLIPTKKIINYEKKNQLLPHLYLDKNKGSSYDKLDWQLLKRIDIDEAIQNKLEIKKNLKIDSSGKAIVDF